MSRTQMSISLFSLPSTQSKILSFYFVFRAGDGIHVYMDCRYPECHLKPKHFCDRSYGKDWNKLFWRPCLHMMATWMKSVCDVANNERFMLVGLLKTHAITWRIKRFCTQANIEHKNLLCHINSLSLFFFVSYFLLFRVQREWFVTWPS